MDNSQIEWNETMKVIAAGIISTVAAELIQYVLIYSREEYKDLKEKITSCSEKLEKEKEQLISVARQKASEKKRN